MNKLVNGKIVEMTPEEIAQMEQEQAEYEAWLKQQPPTEMELMQAQINDLNLVIADMIGGTL